MMYFTSLRYKIPLVAIPKKDVSPKFMKKSFDKSQTIFSDDLRSGEG